MLDTKYDWQMVPDQNAKLVAEIQKQCQLAKPLANLLVARGYQSVQDVQLFLKPQLQQISSPTKLHDMDQAVSRIKDAVNNGEQITVYGDYDADGMTATSVVYEALETMGAKVDYYIPDRFKDGYGPNKDAYQRIIDNGTQLIITVDNGVTGKDEVAFAKGHQVDVVITDHHSLPKELPEAVAIVHPQYPGAEYPYGDLSGVGVAFKLVWGLLGEFPTEMLDLVAIGEIADLVSMAKENHVLVKLGIQQLQQGLRPGIQALLKLGGVVTENLTSQDVAFKLAPRLNALGRIANGNDGVKLLTTVDEGEATTLAEKVDQCNRQRQQLVEQITKEALAKAAAPDNLKRKTLLIIGHGWHQGVLGIVASKVVEQTGKPTIIASVNDGELVAKGSGRSVDGYDLFAALDPHRNLMTSFGGHVMACGMSFMITQVPAIAKVLEASANEQELDLNSKPKLSVTGTLRPDELTEQLYDQVQKLAPFGPDNEEPVFEIEQPTIIQQRQMGQDHQHLKFTLAAGNHNIDVLAFGRGRDHDYFVPGASVTIAGTISLNVWRGRRNVQFLLMDQQIVGRTIVDARTQQLLPEMFQEEATYVVFNQQLRQNISGHVRGRVIDGNKPLVDDDYNRELIVVDVPQTIQQLIKVLNSFDQASEVKLYLFDQQKLHTDQLPTRDNFVQLYQTVRKSGTINLEQQASALGNYLHVSGNQLIFMIKVFLELRFVTIKNGLLNLATNIQNGRLEKTQVYQKYAARLQVENILLKSNTKTLNEWVQKQLHSH